MTEPALPLGTIQIVKHSLVIAGHRTSVSLEDIFWEGLKRIARARNLSLAGLVAEIDAQRQEANLSSAIRVYVFTYFTSQSADSMARAD
jgi:hypothetical protein